MQQMQGERLRVDGSKVLLCLDPPVAATMRAQPGISVQVPLEYIMFGLRSPVPLSRLHELQLVKADKELNPPASSASDVYSRITSDERRYTETAFQGRSCNLEIWVRLRDEDDRWVRVDTHATLVF